MKGIHLTMIENEIYKDIKYLHEKGGNKARVAIKHNKSIRTIDRMIVKYKEKGKAAFVHGNRNRQPVTTISNEIVNEILRLYKGKYKGFNITHFNEKLRDVENILVSYSFLKELFKSRDIISPKAHRKTRREYNKKLKLQAKQNIPIPTIQYDKPIEIPQINEPLNIIDQVIIKDNEVAIEYSHPRQERAKYFGEVVQMDASHHLWFGKVKSHLHLAIDNCTGRLIGAYFDWQETLSGYYNVLDQILNDYGIPYMFLTDNRTIFNYKSLNSKKLENDTFTQFSFACSILGTDIETSSIPQSKGQIERSFNTHQSRLINELRLEGVTTIEEANQFLKSYIPIHNKKFALQDNNIKSAFEKQPSKETINLILSTRYQRTVDNGNTIKFKNNYYQTFEDGSLITLKPKSKGMVIESFDGNLYFESAEKVYRLCILKKNKAKSELIDNYIPPKKDKRKIGNKPPSNHSWRNSMITKHQKKLREKTMTLEQYFDDCEPMIY